MTTDQKLKSALAKMLPDVTHYTEIDGLWHKTNKAECPVLDTELLHLCALAENTLNAKERCRYRQIAWHGGEWSTTKERLLRATWQQRVTALAKVKGIEV